MEKSDLQMRIGSLAAVPRSSIAKYVAYLAFNHSDALSKAKFAQEGGQQAAFALTYSVRKPSVEKLGNAIRQNSILRMYFQGGIQNIPQGGVLYKHSLNEVLDMINSAVVTPPSAANQQITGVPIYALFVDLMDNSYGEAFFASFEVNMIFKEIFQDYFKMLCSHESRLHMNKKPNGGWFAPDVIDNIDYTLFECDPSRDDMGFQNWNDFFIRKFKPTKLKEILDKSPLDIQIVQSSESIPLPKQPTQNVKATDSFWLKQAKYSLYDMFNAEKQGIKDIVDNFVGGSIYQAFLTPWCYHRWHAPVAGTIEKAFRVQGVYYMQNPALWGTNLSNKPKQQNYVDSQPFLCCNNTRQVYIINTHNPKIGRVGVIEIGMCQVSSCNNLVKQGQQIQKGGQLGYFAFGGSSHALVFEKKCKLKFSKTIHNYIDRIMVGELLATVE